MVSIPLYQTGKLSVKQIAFYQNNEIYGKYAWGSHALDGLYWWWSENSFKLLTHFPIIDYIWREFE